MFARAIVGLWTELSHGVPKRLGNCDSWLPGSLSHRRRRGHGSEGKMEGLADDGRDGVMKRTYTQAEVDEKSRGLIAKKLTRLISGYDGSAKAAKEILRG